MPTPNELETFKIMKMENQKGCCIVRFLRQCRDELPKYWHPSLQNRLYEEESGMNYILPWSERRPSVRVAVIGDIILDEYLEGSVSRISPEAPVPVHLVKSVSHSAGGAANAARNISLAGGEVDLFGVCGKDEPASVLFNLLKKDGVHTDSIISVADRPTNRKTRVTSSNHQLVRIDWERVQALEEKNQELLLKNLSNKQFDAVLVSDYGKGLLPTKLLQNIFKYAQERKIPVVVDPKGSDFSRYKGCTVMTPNMKECHVALGIDEDIPIAGEELGRQLQSRFGLNDVLVTMGAQGMIYVPNDTKKATVYRKAKAKEVFDVSGAGDTVAAILALGLGAGSSSEDLINLANTAAAIVVAKWGTQAVTEAELHNAMFAETHGASSSVGSKILKFEELSQLKLRCQKESRRVVFTNGCFDIIHAGHVDYLEKAKHLGDVLIVGVNTDESIREIKGEKRPIVELAHRMKVLSALSFVDYIVPFSEKTPLRLIEELSPQVLVKGADYKVDDIVGAKHVKANGGSIQTIDLVPGISTSTLVDRIQKQS